MPSPRPAARRKLRFEACESRNLLAADITGVKLQDLTANGFSADDTPLGGVTIELFQDNGDGTFDPNVDALIGTQVTDPATGAYTFSNVADGLYFVREVVPAGFFQTAGPAFYTVQVQGNNAFTLNGVSVDDFSQPVPVDAYFINALDPDPTLIKHDVAGVIGGQRDALIDVLGTSNATSAAVVVGFNGITGVFSFGSGQPGTTAILQYDGADADVVGPPASLVNAQGLSTDLTNGGLATGFLLDFDRVDPGLGTTLRLDIRLTGPGGATATLTDTTSLVENLNPSQLFVPFSAFITAGGFSFADVNGIDVQFNANGVPEVDFDLDAILTAGLQADFGNAQFSSLAGFVYYDADNDGVFDPTEAPIPGTTVTLTGTDDLGAAVNTVDVTDATGAYQFTDLRPGTYTITETQPAGYLDGKDTIGTPGGTTGNDVFSNIILPAGFDGVNNNFGELLASSIGGFVYYDADNDGVFDPTEAPIPGTTVTLTGTDDLGAAVNTVDVTDATGAYQFTGLRPGTYTITETQPAGYLDGKDTIGTPGGTTGNDVFSNIILPAGFDGVNNNFGELLASSIGGFVYYDADNDGVFDPTEAPIPGTTVTLTGTDDLGAAVNSVDVTDATGAYQFTGLRPGTYTITETQPAGYLDGKDTIGTPGGTTGNDVFSNIILPAGFDGVNNNFGELLASSIGGFVYYDADNDGVFDPTEAPIPGTTVTLTGTDDLGAAVNTVDVTDATGAYQFTGLRPGTYTITETQPAGYLDGKDTIGTPGGTTGNDVFSNIILPAGFDGVNNNFGELLASSIGGFVYYDADNDGVFDPTEAPIPGTTVTLTGTDDLGAAVNSVDVTDATGAYQFTGLRPGTYTITETQPAGYLDGKDTIGTPGGTTGNDVFSNIILPAGFDGVNNNFGELLPASLAGFVYIDQNNDGSRAGDPGIPGVTVTLTGTDDLGAAVNTVVFTDATGAYLFSNLRPGTYVITETQPAGFDDGIDTIGTPGGNTANDVFFNIVLPAGFNGVENNFGELQRTTPQVSSISGFVYIDVNDDGIKAPTEFTIGNVLITLTGTDNQGNPVNLNTLTDITGFYKFSNLQPGTYKLTETQPNGFLDGKDTIGTPGGTTTNDMFSNIALVGGFDGVNNNFGERGLSDPSKSLLLASTPVPPDLSNLGVVIGVPAGVNSNAGLVAQASSGGGAGSNAGWFDAVYDDVLERDPSSFEVSKQSASLSTGQMSHRDIAEDLLESRERKAKIIEDLYEDYLGRNSDPGGMEFWLGIWDRFNGPERVQAGIIGSPEYYQTAGGSDAAWVSAMYQNILGRTAGASEVDYHVNRLHQPGVNTQAIVLGFVYSDEYRSGLIQDWYFDYLVRAPEQGGVQYWLGQMKTGQSQESIQAGLLGSLEYRAKH